MRYVLIVTGLIFTCMVPAVMAEQTSETTTKMPPLSFEKADQDKDGVVDRKEFEARMSEIFDTKDLNQDQYLTLPELGQMRPEVLEKAGKDQKLSRRQYIKFRFADFERLDDNTDGVITRDELKNW